MLVLKATTLNTHDNKKKEKVDWISTDRRKPDVMASLIQLVLLTLLEGENLIRKIPSSF